MELTHSGPMLNFMCHGLLSSVSTFERASCNHKSAPNRIAPPLAKEVILHSSLCHTRRISIVSSNCMKRGQGLNPLSTAKWSLHQVSASFQLEQRGACHIAKSPDCLPLARHSSLSRHRSLTSIHLHHTPVTFSRPTMSSIRISETGEMRQCMAHYDHTGHSDRSNHITHWSAQGEPPSPRRSFAGWTADGEPMMAETDKDGSMLQSGHSRSDTLPRPPKKSSAAWAEGGTPVRKRPEGNGSTPRPSDNSISELKRRSRIPPSTIRVTTADGLKDDKGNLERDVSMRFFPSGSGKEAKVPNLHQEWAIHFAVKQQRSIPWGSASQRSGRTKAVQAFNQAEELHPWVKVIRRPQHQEQGTVGCETWIRVEEPQVWSGVLP